MRSTLVRLIVLLTLAAVAGMGYYLVKRIPEKKLEVPMVQVKRGDLIVRSYVRGELRAVRSTSVTCPNLGATTQVTRLAPAGALAQAKDLIVEFDDSELLASLEDAELEVSQVGENIKKAEADQAIRRNQDQVDLLRAKYSVRRGELEVKRNELISKIDGRKNELTLEEAKRALTKLEEDVKSRLQQGEAELAVFREQRRKAQLEVNRVKTRIAQTKMLSPITGLVAVKENRSGGFNFGQQSPDIREGDQLSPGTPVAEILDLSELEVAARVNELERASLREGQEVLVRLDALPGRVVHGKIDSLSGTASSNLFSSDPTKKFDCVFSVNMREMLTHVGATQQQIEKIIATAAENAKNFTAAVATPPAAPMMMMAGGPGGAPGGGPPGGGPPAGATDADRQKIREAMQKALGGRDLQSMSAEDRQKLFAGLREKTGGQAGGPRGGGGEATPGAGGGRGGPGGGGRRGGRGEGSGEAGGGAPAGGPGGPGMMVMQGPGGGGPPDLTQLSLRPGASQRFSAADREKAQLPAPPEEGSVMDVLLRPGLLVEAEIIVEKIPNTLYVPLQAVYEKGGRNVVYIRAGNRFDARPVKLGQRTESQVAVVEGVREGEAVALQDMETGGPQKAPKKGSKDKDKGKSGGQPSMPGAGGPKA